MVTTSPTPEGFVIEVEVTPEHIDEFCKDMSAKNKAIFLEQFQPRLALILEKETQDYLEHSLRFFGEVIEDDSDNTPTT